MLRRRPITFAALAVLAVSMLSAGRAFAVGSTPPVGGGGACTYVVETDPVSSITYQGEQIAINDGLYTCNSSNTYVPEGVMVGSVDQTGSALTCSTTTAGVIEYTGGSFLGCNGTTFGSLASGGGSTTLNSIAAAVTTTSINSGANAITWAWNSLSTQTALTISTTSALTGGALLSLQATAASSTSTGYALSISDSTTGAGYGIYSSMTATANTGYAIYVTNTGAGYALGATGTSYFNGRVGIGTSAPNSALALYTTTTGGLGLTMNNAASGGAEWERRR